MCILQHPYDRYGLRCAFFNILMFTPDHLDCSNDRYGFRCAFFNILMIAMGFDVLSSTSICLPQIIWTAPMIAMGFDVRPSTSLMFQIIWTAPNGLRCLSILRPASIKWKCFMIYLDCPMIFDFVFFNKYLRCVIWIFSFIFILKFCLAMSSKSTRLHAVQR